MPRRSKSFDEVVSEEMKDIDFSRESLLASMEHFGDSVEDALRRTINKMGVTEFSNLSQITHQNVAAFARGERSLKKIETLDKYLSVFGLKSKIIALKKDDVA